MDKGFRKKEVGMDNQISFSCHRTELASLALLGSSTLDPGRRRVVDEGVNVVAGFPKGADNSMDSSQCCQLGLNRSHLSLRHTNMSGQCTSASARYFELRSIVLLSTALMASCPSL